MPSYLVTGASRGLGAEFVRQLSARPDSIVIGFVRNKQATDEKLPSDLKRDNIHTVEADLTDYASLKQALEVTSELTGGSLDYIFASAAYINDDYSYITADKMATDHLKMEDELNSSFKTNVVGNMHLFSLAMPLVLKGSTKKVIAISSGLADLDLVSQHDVAYSVPYTISKAAMNMAVAKFSAQYRKDGVLFMSVCPGVVDTKDPSKANPDQLAAMQDLAGKFMQYQPNWTGPSTPATAAKKVLEVVENASTENGYAGTFVSQFGNKQWL